MPTTCIQSSSFEVNLTITIDILGAVVSVLHVRHTDDGVGDSIVDHGVHGHCDAVLGEELEREESEGRGNDW